MKQYTGLRFQNFKTLVFDDCQIDVDGDYLVIIHGVLFRGLTEETCTLDVKYEDIVEKEPRTYHKLVFTKFKIADIESL